jgi:hypothetical protein
MNPKQRAILEAVAIFHEASVYFSTSESSRSKKSLRSPDADSVYRAYLVIRSAIEIWISERRSLEIEVMMLLAALRDSWEESRRVFPKDVRAPHLTEANEFLERGVTLVQIFVYLKESFASEQILNSCFQMSKIPGRFQEALRLTTVKLQVAFVAR